jgi:hypothetical protein
MDDVTSFNGGLGRIDTIAHEFGHNLDLGHYENSAYSSYFMASGTYRSVPSTLGSIFPDGYDYDYLASDDISTARKSSLLSDATVPEPSTLLLLSPGLLCLVFLRKRSSIANG